MLVIELLLFLCPAEQCSYYSSFSLSLHLFLPPSSLSKYPHAYCWLTCTQVKGNSKKEARSAVRFALQLFCHCGSLVTKLEEEGECLKTHLSCRSSLL